MNELQRLVGIYDADGTLRGEVAYWVGARLGRAHCALCDITHSAVGERSSWKTCRAGLPVPFDTIHRDEAPPEIIEATDGQFPAVVADTVEGVVPLLDGDALEGYAADPEALMAAVEEAIEARGLAWPSPTPA